VFIVGLKDVTCGEKKLQ